ncbi:MAG: hypothetical protein ACRCXT_12945 [Paraclostridium sp.]
MNNNHNTKLYDNVFYKDLSYDEALKYLEEGFYITRMEWLGFHYKSKFGYSILCKECTIIHHPDSIYDTDKKDWCVVDITQHALSIIVDTL